MANGSFCVDFYPRCCMQFKVLCILAITQNTAISRILGAQIDQRVRDTACFFRLHGEIRHEL